MKYYARFCGLILVSITFLPAVGSAQVLLTEDFEAYTLDSWPSAWVPDANASDVSNNRVVLDPTGAQNQVLKLFGAINSCWAALAFHPVVFPTDFFVRTLVYNGSETLGGCHPERAYIGLRQGTSWANPGRGLIQFKGNGDIAAYNGAVLQTYATDRWYEVVIHYSRVDADLTLEYWIDGVNRGLFSIAIDPSIHASFDHLDLTSQEGSSYFDEVLVSTCGNGTVDAGEQCDDGNILDGDCCSSTCQFEAPGSSCDDGQVCTSDSCDGVGVCVGTLDPSVCLDHFMNYKVRPNSASAKFVKFGPVQLSDQFASANYDVIKPVNIGLPGDKNAEGVIDPVTHLEEYKVKAVRGTPKFTKITDISIINQCNDLLVEVRKPASLLIPTSKDRNNPVAAPDPQLHNVDHFLCYKTKVQKKLVDGTKLPRFPKGTQVAVTDQFQTRRYDLRKLTRLCVPVDKSEDPVDPPVLLSGPDKGTQKLITPAVIRNPEAHLVCYRAVMSKSLVPQNGCGCDEVVDPTCRGSALTPVQAAHTRVVGLHTNNQFGPEQHDTLRSVELCIPSQKILPPGP